MKDQSPESGVGKPALTRVRVGDRRCPHCGSDKWVHVDNPRTIRGKGSATGVAEVEEVPHKYGCSHCGGEFYVEAAMRWKRTKDANRCPHCRSDKVVVAVKMDHGAVIACLKCNNLALFEHPGFKGKVTVEDVKRAGRLTEEAQKLYGERGFYFEIKREKARRRTVAGKA